MRLFVWWGLVASLVGCAPTQTKPTATSVADANVVAVDGPPDAATVAGTAATSAPEIVADPTRVVAGGVVELRFPNEIMRGVPYFLSRWDGAAWGAPSYLLISDGSGMYDCRGSCPSWSAIDDAEGWDDIGISGPGPDRIVIPNSAPSGRYRACSANAADESFCVELEVLDGE